MPRGTNIYDETRLQNRLWTPNLFKPAIWLDASDLSTITFATGASQWRDKSGNQRDISQAVATQQPQLITNAQNGLSVLRFDGVNDIMFSSSVGASGLSTFQMLAVFRVVSGGANEDILMGIGQTQSAGTIRTFYRATSGTTVGFAGWSADVASSAYSYDIGGGYHLFTCWNTQLAGPNQIRIGRDGNFTTYTTGSLNFTTDGFSVGSLRGGAVSNYYANIEVGEIIVRYNDFSPKERQLYEGYLAWKWGLQNLLVATHPFANRPPLIGD